MTKKISLIIPAFNEEDCIDELSKRLIDVFQLEKEYEFEVLYVENGSVDLTLNKMEKIREQDNRFKIIQLSRNFRLDGGLTAGLNYATGDACILMTSDLQDPPEFIPNFLREWENGYENIYGLITQRGGTKLLRRINSRVFYWIANKLAKNFIVKGASDFRLLDRRAYESLRTLNERNRFVRGLSAWVGFSSKALPLERPARFAGVSQAHTGKVIDLAIKGIFAFSNIPLRIGSLFGIAMFFLSSLSTISMSIAWVFFGVPFAGFGTIVALILALIGVVTFMLSVLAEYMGLIYEEVKNRPNFVVKKTSGIN